MTTTVETEPTLEDVGLMEARLVDLEVQADELEEREQQLTKQIAEIHTGGTGSKKDLPNLTQQRREARDGRVDVVDAIALLRDQIKHRRGVVAVEEAKKRQTGIAKAHGRLQHDLTNDEAAVEAASIDYRQKVDRVNERFHALSLLKAEAEALADRLGVPAPRFAPVTVPALREACMQAALVVGNATFLDHGHIAKATERCEHALRTRRTYREVSGTPTAAIIRTAGSQPWPPLTTAQQEVIASRKRDAEAEAATAARFEGEASRGLQRRSL